MYTVEVFPGWCCYCTVCTCARLHICNMKCANVRTFVLLLYSHYSYQHLSSNMTISSINAESILQIVISRIKCLYFKTFCRIFPCRFLMTVLRFEYIQLCFPVRHVLQDICSFHFSRCLAASLSSVFVRTYMPHCSDPSLLFLNMTQLYAVHSVLWD